MTNKLIEHVGGKTIKVEQFPNDFKLGVKVKVEKSSISRKGSLLLLILVLYAIFSTIIYNYCFIHFTYELYLKHVTEDTKNGKHCTTEYSS